MAFTMTHLIISENISEIFANRIESLPQYYLGSIALDAVHNRANIDLPDIIYAAEIDKQKDNILNSWYKDKERQDISSNKIRTYENEMEFIQNAADYVARIFQENL